jgi:hypothetical protein
MVNDDWKMQVSYKTPTGDLINIRANTADELSVNLESIGDYATQIAATQAKIAGAFTLNPLSTSSSTASTMPPSFLAQVSGPPASVTSGPTCPHGARIHKSGVSSKTGKPYSMWVCPLPQGADQCKPVN